MTNKAIQNLARLDGEVDSAQQGLLDLRRAISDVRIAGVEYPGIDALAQAFDAHFDALNTAFNDWALGHTKH